MIQDYSELIAEASHRSGLTNIAQRARMLVGMAEKICPSVCDWRTWKRWQN